MGEAKLKDIATEQAVEAMKASQGRGQAVNLTLPQAVVLTGCNEAVAFLGAKAGFMEQIGQKDAAKELLSAAEHLSKFQARYLSESQRAIIIPPPPVVTP